MTKSSLNYKKDSIVRLLGKSSVISTEFPVVCYLMFPVQKRFLFLVDLVNFNCNLYIGEMIDTDKFRVLKK